MDEVTLQTVKDLPVILLSCGYGVSSVRRKLVDHGKFLELPFIIKED
jgi:hypothetical protein